MKLKSIQKTGAMILTVIMLLCMNIIPALAATDASGRDTSKPVSLTLIKLENKKSPETVQPDLDIRAAAAPEGFETTISGMKFQIQQAKLKSGKEQGSVNPGDYEVVGTFKAIGTTDLNGKIVFSTSDSLISNTADVPLPGQGIYLVTELPNATGKPASSLDGEFVVNLPMTNETGDGWVYDVIVYPKNNVDDGPDIIKKKTENSNSNIINWEYGVDIPSDIKEAGATADGKLIITDVLDSRLAYVIGSIKGSYTDLDGTEHPLTVDTHYTATYNTANGKNDLVITITKPAGFNELAKGLDSTGSGENAPMMYFTFDTSLDITDENNTGIINNGGQLQYTNSNGYKYDKNINENKKPEADLFAINVYKINVKEEALAGAKFKLYSDVALEKEITTAKVVTGQDGNLYIYGIVEGTYYLSETDAPTGYNKITTPIEVVVNSAKADVNSVVKVTVTNSNNFSLPLTGGTGTILFTVGGLILIGTAITFFIVSRKKKAI